MARITEIKFMNPKLKQKKISNELCFLSSTIQLYRNDIKLQSPYKSNNPNITSKTSNDLKRSQMVSKDEIGKPVSKKLKSKNVLKVGYPNDDNPINGRDLIEQIFSSN